MIGSDNNDTITGDSTANFLSGGLGDDTLTGGGGNDTFSFDLHSNNAPGANDGHDVITDYSEANNVLQFHHVVDQHSGSTNYGDLLDDLAKSITSVADDGVNTTINFNNGSSVQLNNVSTGAAHTDTTTAAVTTDLGIINGGGVDQEATANHLQIATAS